jgi:YD repeat-containing protein
MSNPKISYVSPGVIDVTDANNATTRMQFTSTGQVQRITDPLNRTTQFSYDAQRMLIRQSDRSDPLNQIVRFTYRAN